MIKISAELLKKNYFYIIFLKIRVLTFTDSKLISQLLKRAHLLDKLNQDGKASYRHYIAREVEICIDQVLRRNLKIDGALKWCFDIFQEIKFGRINHVKNEFSQDRASNPSNLEDIIKSRRSVRKWNNEEVSDELIKKAIDCAQWAPSSCNRQSRFFLVLTKREYYSYLKRMTTQSFFENAEKIIMCFVDLKDYNDSEYSYAFLDMGASIQNLLLELYNLNLGPCQLGIRQTKDNKAIFNDLINKFNLSKTMVPVSFVAVGKYNDMPIAPGRKNVEDISKFI